MADIEVSTASLRGIFLLTDRDALRQDRIKKHSHAFEGLLSLVPVNENKRKLTKEEKRKEAKKAKLDPTANRKKVLKEGKKENKKEEGQNAAPLTSEESSPTKQDEQKKKRKAKATPKQKQTDGKTLETASGNGDSDGNAEAEVEAPTEKKKLEPKPSSQKKAKAKAPTKPKEQPPKPPKSPSNPPPETPDLPTTEPTSSNSSSTSPSPSTTPTTPSPPPKPPVTAAERAEARARLTAHIIALRSKRKADNPDGTSAKNRHALLEARQKREVARKERKKALRLAAKLADEGIDNSPLVSSATTTTSTTRPPPIEKPQNDFMFGAVTFDDGQELDHTLGDFKKTRKRKGPTDVMGQLKQAEAKKARLENMDPEKAEKIYEKEMWSKALKQTAGEKVRDDEKLLKKALKRQEVQKRKSEREWKERKDTVSKGIAMRQKKREENINARKEQKKLGKAGKKAKTGGKKKVQKKGKSKSRPGFEGSMKSGKPGGKPAGKPAGKSGSGGGGKRFGK